MSMTHDMIILAVFGGSGLAGAAALGAYGVTTARRLGRLERRTLDLATLAPAADAAGRGSASAALERLGRALEQERDLTRRLQADLAALNGERESDRASQIHERSHRAKAVDTLGEALEQLALGDLDVRIEERFPPGFDQLRIDFNASMEALGRVMGSILEATEAVSFGASELSRAAQRLAARTDQQAQSVKTSSQSLDSLMREVTATTDNAHRVQDAIVLARQSAEQSTEIMQTSVEAMAKIKASSSEIGEISSVIDEIAFQTSLLALNAGVEAARAGDSGRGFAVVAQEVRALAERSAKAARAIGSIVERSNRDVAEGGKQINATQSALADIANQVIGVHALIETINESSRLQNDSIGAIGRAMSEIDKITENNVAMVAEATEASRVLADEAKSLTTSVAGFKSGGSGDSPDASASEANAEIDRLFA
jgi:methyl-accepting chemotaxis protein